VADDIRTLTATLARDPSSLQYVELAEALRQKGKLAEALQVAMLGIGRHPGHADGFDCIARIHSDRGDMASAREAWERVLAIVPEHAGALKGVGFLYWKQGDTRRAADALEHALAANPDDWMAKRALEMIRGTGKTETEDRRPDTEKAAVVPSPVSGIRSPSEVPQLRATAAALRAAQVTAAERDADAAAARDAALKAAGVPGNRDSLSSVLSPSPASGLPPVSDPRPPVFAGLEGATADILLLDGRGLVMAGGLKNDAGADVSELAAAALAGVSGEAGRTAGYLNLGIWTTIVAEAEHANVVLSPVGDNALLMLRRDKSTPVGLALRIADRAKSAAGRWLEQQG
jgi:predicted regulator of Ras-like GTPase activity (Roadblock/LC7/MglB family)